MPRFTPTKYTGDSHENISSEEFANKITFHLEWLNHRDQGVRLALDRIHASGATPKYRLARRMIINDCYFFRLQFTSNGTDCDFSRTQFERCNLEGVSLQRSDCSYCTFYDTNLNRVDLRDTHLTGARGLYGPSHAITHNCRNAMHAVYGKTFRIAPISFPDFLHWGRIRLFANARLLKSALPLALIITTATLASKAINNAIDRLNVSLQDLASSTSIPSHIQQILTSSLPLAHIPLPSNFGWALLAIVLLAISHAIYNSCCPEFVREHSETAWTRAMNQSLVEYRSACYTYYNHGTDTLESIRRSMPTRYVWAMLFFVSSAYLFIYTAEKLALAVAYLWKL